MGVDGIRSDRVIIDAATLGAYRDTDYRVFAGSGVVTLRIGERSDALRALHVAAGVDCSVFITACNPFGAVREAADNDAAMQRLLAYLGECGIVWIRGEGQGRDSAWPAEPSVLALGVTANDARHLCAMFEQNAVVVNAADAVPRLLLHPDAHTAGAPAA